MLTPENPNPPTFEPTPNHSSTFLQDLVGLPAEIAYSFATPPPRHPRAFAAYLARDLPAIVLTSAATIGLVEVFHRIEETYEVNNFINSLEWMTLILGVFPLSTAVRRLTFGISQNIDHWINPNQEI